MGDPMAEFRYSRPTTTTSSATSRSARKIRPRTHPRCVDFRSFLFVSHRLLIVFLYIGTGGLHWHAQGVQLRCAVMTTVICSPLVAGSHTSRRGVIAAALGASDTVSVVLLLLLSCCSCRQRWYTMKEKLCTALRLTTAVVLTKAPWRCETTYMILWFQDGCRNIGTIPRSLLILVRDLGRFWPAVYVQPEAKVFRLWCSLLQLCLRRNRAVPNYSSVPIFRQPSSALAQQRQVAVTANENNTSVNIDHHHSISVAAPMQAASLLSGS
jgi:hypothetical protein